MKENSTTILAKKRILNLLDENMRNFKKDSWNKQNRMNKLIVDIDIHQ